MSESSSSSDNEAVLAACMTAAASAQAAAAKTEGPFGSKPGRATKRDLGVKKASVRLENHYFCRFHDGVPVLNEKDFERTYRMPRRVYETVGLTIMEGRFFLQNRDATNKEGASTELKLFAALFMLTNGRSAESLVQKRACPSLSLIHI